MLNQDSITLGQYGLFDNCVVHCHVSQPRPPNEESSNSRGNNTSSSDEEEQDLSELLVSVLTSLLNFTVI